MPSRFSSPGFALFCFVCGFAVVRPAAASFHLMQIEEVVAGVYGDTTAQAIQLRQRSAGQNFVKGAQLIAYDAMGKNPVVLITFPTNVTNSTAGSSILAATANFSSRTAGALAPDFTLTNAIPDSYLAAGRLDYTDGAGSVLWSVIYGGTAYQGPTTGSNTNDRDGNFGPAFTGALPSTNGEALKFSGGAAAASTSSSTDYALTTGGASFTNSAGTSAALAAPVTTDLPKINKGKTRLSLRPVANGLTSPLELMSARDGTNRLFIVDRIGLVRVIKNGALAATPFLDVRSRVVLTGETGLLGVAFHPGFANSASPGFHKIYTYTSEARTNSTDFPLIGGTVPDHQSVFAEWQVSAADPDQIDPASRREVLRLDQPQSNHNGGQIGFRPSDGYLYIGLGDGGFGGDTGAGHAAAGNGQTLSTLLGKIVRIDPLAPSATPGSTDPASANGKYRVPASNPFNGTNGLREIYAYGFRNPFRFSFDTNNTVERLVVGDVGQNRVEEVDLVELGKNYGWRRKEGTFLYNSDGTTSVDMNPDPALINPVLQYDHDEGTAVLGGVVYRGATIPTLVGKYLFGDFSQPGSGGGRLFVGDFLQKTIEEIRVGINDLPKQNVLLGFGRDAANEVYVLGLDTSAGGTGFVKKFGPRPATLAVGSGVGVSPRVRQLDGDGTPIRTIAARVSTFRGGIPVAVGDVDGDGVADLITGSGRGGAATVRVFSGANGSKLANFVVADPSFRGGVYVAAADVDGDGKSEIITGLGAGGAPQVQIYPGVGGAAIASFLAYDANFKGGVRVAAGDVLGTGTPAIVTGPGGNSAPVVNVFTTAGAAMKSFNAYDPSFRGGVFVSTGDVDGDGTADIITGPGSGSAPTVKVFKTADLSLLAIFNAYAATFRGGVHVGSVDVSGAGDRRIVTVPASGNNTTIRYFNGTGQKTKELKAFNQSPGTGPFATGASE